MISSLPYFVGVDIGGTNIKVAAVTQVGAILAKVQFSIPGVPAAAYAAAIRERVEQLQSDLGEPIGIGVATPGLIGKDHRSVAWMQGRMEWTRGIDWSHLLNLPFPIPVINDAKAALIAEAWVGAAVGVKNAILLTLGTGVGGAAMVDGHLLHGNIGRAGHLGHISLDAAGRPDIVETPGSLEDQVGDATIGLRSDGRYESTQVLVTAVREGDEFAVRVWQESIRQLAAGIVSLINVLDPEVVILGGGITRAGHALFGPLRTRLAEIEWRPFGPGVVLVPAALDEFSGAAGAARFAMTFHQRPFREGL